MYIYISKMDTQLAYLNAFQAWKGDENLAIISLRKFLHICVQGDSTTGQHTFM